MDFQPGDMVTLRTSAWPMTVETLDGDYVWCVSKDAKGKTQRERFSRVVLQKFAPRGPMRVRF